MSYINDIVPQCKICKDKIPKFQNFNLGYKDYCSVSCSVKDNKLKQENTRIKNIQNKCINLSVNEIIQGIYNKKLKIQKWRDIEKLKAYIKFYSINQVYNHVILKNNQICEYCMIPYDIDKKTKESRKCNCTNNTMRIFIEIKDFNNKDFITSIIEQDLYISFSDNHKNGAYKEIRNEYRKRFNKISDNFQEDLYCRINSMEPLLDMKFVSFNIGYKEKEIKIDYSNSNKEILNNFKEKYQNEHKTSNEFIYWILHFNGSTVEERIKNILNYSEKYIHKFLFKKVKNNDILKLRCNIDGVNYIDNNKFSCNKCGNIFYQLNNISKKIICGNCTPKISGYSLQEKEVLNFIKTFYNGEIKENDRHLGIELDMFIPELNLAIEYNGLYWHSSRFKEKKYHLNKTEICEKNNIQLIQIFENEWLQKKEIVKSILKVKLGFNAKRIYARKCIIKEVHSKISNKFLEDNHIQGKDNAPIKYGLYYQDELVKIVTFKRTHRSKDKYMELKRSASKIGYSVVGGFSKLMKYSKAIIREDIVTFADRRYSYKENIYSKIGTYIGTIPPNHFYINGTSLEGREKYQKHKLKDIFKNFDGVQTAIWNCYNNGIYEIYDAGNLKYIL